MDLGEDWHYLHFNIKYYYVNMSLNFNRINHYNSEFKTFKEELYSSTNQYSLNSKSKVLKILPFQLMLLQIHLRHYNSNNIRLFYKI